MMIQGTQRPKYTILNGCQRTSRRAECATYFMEQETHETGSNDRVVDPNVPSSPKLLQPTELGQVDMRVELVGGRVSSCCCCRVKSHGE